IYNIGTGVERTNLDVVEEICNAIAERNEIDRGRLKELIKFVSDRPGHDRRYAIDTSRVRSGLGWRPQMEFARGVGHTVQWYLDHGHWIAQVTSGEYRNYYELVYSRAWGQSA